MNKVVLFPNLAQFESTSMKRYALELSEALHSHLSGSWEVEDFHCDHVEWVAQSIKGTCGRKLADRLGRLVKYPLVAARVPADIYHILDQSHANVGMFLNPLKTIITCHDIIPLLAKQGILPIDPSPISKISYPLRLALIRKFAAVIAVSESTKRDLVKYAGIPENRIAVVHNGLNCHFRQPESSDARLKTRRLIESRHGIPPDAKIVMHVGSVARYKNSPAIIRAIAELNRIPEFQSKVFLLRLGSDFFNEEKELIAGIALSDRVIYQGSSVDDQTLASYYQAADVLAFPSFWEGFGWPPLEAMACGTPVVTSNAASLPEVVGDAGIMVPPGDDPGFVAALKRVLCDGNLRAGMIQRGLAQASMFTWERAAKKVLAVYEQVLRS